MLDDKSNHTHCRFSCLKMREHPSCTIYYRDRAILNGRVDNVDVPVSGRLSLAHALGVYLHPCPSCPSAPGFLVIEHTGGTSAFTSPTEPCRPLEGRIGLPLHCFPEPLLTCGIQKCRVKLGLLVADADHDVHERLGSSWRVAENHHGLLLERQGMTGCAVQTVTISLSSWLETSKSLAFQALRFPDFTVFPSLSKNSVTRPVAQLNLHRRSRPHLGPLEKRRIRPSSAAQARFPCSPPGYRLR